MATIIPLADARAQSRADALAAFVRDAALAPALPGPVADARGRPLHDLRISVTDRCNFRCIYCMPKDVFGHDYPFLPHAELLTFEEITRVARVFAGLGVRKIRLTGGEPLLRKKIERLIEMLRGIGDLDLTLTTNGALLARKAMDLRAAGLSRVTVSLDALDDAIFRRMNDADFPVAAVLDGIAAARAAGLGPLKVNMVVKRGTNDDQILPMARHFKGSGAVLRFIEYMDVGATNGWRMDEVLPSAEVVRRIAAHHPVEPIAASAEGETAQRWRYLDGSGEFGVISSVTQAFCADCNRARLSTEGKLFLCLFASRGHDLRAMLRSDLSDADLDEQLRGLWRARDDRYSELRTQGTPLDLPKVEMSHIGG